MQAKKFIQLQYMGSDKNYSFAPQSAEAYALTMEDLNMRHKLMGVLYGIEAFAVISLGVFCAYILLTCGGK